MAIAMVKGLDMKVNTIGDLYEISNKLPAFSAPKFSLRLVQSEFHDALTIALLAAIESLLSAVVADSMVNGRHRSNMELIAQGVGNVASALFGGIPATGAIARTAAMLFMKRMSDVTSVEGWKYIEDDEEDPDSLSLRQVPEKVLVYEISGPMFFGAADKILDISVGEKDEVLILRMRSVGAIDATALHSLELLYEDCKKKKITLILSHTNEQPMHMMEKAGFDQKIGREHFCKHIDDALEKAAEIVGQTA